MTFIWSSSQEVFISRMQDEQKGLFYFVLCLW